MTEKQHRCKCGGVFIIDEAAKRTMHSKPVCAAYRRIIAEGIRRGKVKTESPQVRKVRV